MDPLKKYRRQFRTWRNDRRLQKEQSSYDDLFAARGLAIPTEAELHAACRRLFPALAPKPAGSLQILAVYHDYNWEETALKPALEKFGAVFHFDWFRGTGAATGEWRRSGRRSMNRELLACARTLKQTHNLDVIFAYLSGEQVTPATMAALAALGVPTINLALNDKENFVGKIRGGQAMGVRDICRHFSLCWTSTEDALKKYVVEGARPVYLPEGANPELHRPREVARTIDVSFVGQCYGNRPEIIARLAAAGVKVVARGPGWPGGPLTTEAMVSLYSQSRINLGFAGVHGCTDAFCLKGRDFEIPMSGGLYLTEHHPELEKAYETGREIMTYRDFDDLLAKIRRLLDNPEEAEAIRRRGRERALRDHSWEGRFRKIFRIIGLIE
ncbi:MAG TPA: glycosyltransferase [Syntrophales bacterium]|nr:glycosyltransferase [Syntrophales bacterium]HRR48051.1 glycosyltransferase [Syntrophales bacterium]